MFKNSASLASHKHRYHPYPKTEDTDTSSLYSEASSFSSSLSVLESKVNANQQTIRGLDQVFGSIVRRLEDLEINFRRENSDVKSKYDKDTNKEIKQDIEVVKFQSDLNKRRIQTLQHELNVVADKIDKEAEENFDDILGYLMEVKEMFYNSDYEKLRENIAKVKKIIDTIFKLEIGKDILTSDDEELLSNISDTSDYIAKDILKENFSRLKALFRKLTPEFDEMYEDYYTQEEESEVNSDDEDARSTDDNTNATEVERDHTEDTYEENNDDIEDADEEDSDSSGGITKSNF